jgi:hypothetical protein
MTTTDQPATTDYTLLLEKEKTKMVNAYKAYCKSFSTKLNTFDLKHTSNQGTKATILEPYNSVKFTEFYNLSQHNRLKLTHTADIWQTFTPMSQIGKKVVSATLWISLSVQKNKNVYETHYAMIDKVTNIEGSFVFNTSHPDNYVFLPVYNPLSVEFEYEDKSSSIVLNEISVEQINLNSKLRELSSELQGQMYKSIYDELPTILD